MGWIDAAYESIQNVHYNWNFLRTDFSFSTTATTIVLPEFGEWKPDSFRCYLTATGTDDEQFLEFVPWETFRDAYYFGPSRTQTGRPMMISVKPDNDLLIWPTAEDDYTVIGEYYMKAQVMTADADTPIFPQFHMAIVWKALVYYGAYSSEPDKTTIGALEYHKLLRKLEVTQLPTVSYGASLV